jgi:hypothetical protein
MAAEIKIDLLDFDGSILESDLVVVGGTYARNLSTIGKATITVPDIYPPGYFGRDNMLAIYRTPVDGIQYLEPSAIWFIRKVTLNVDNSEITIEAFDQMHLLKRRLIGYRTETIYADKIAAWGTGPDYADDIMKAFVDENMGDGAVLPTGAADTARDLETPGYLIIEGDKSEGALIEETASFRNLFDTLKGVARKSDEAGTPVFFDLSVSNLGTFYFWTSTNSIGVGGLLSGPQKIAFNAQNGNLSNVRLTWDYEKEITFLYLGGPDSGGGKQISRYSPADLRDVITPFNRIETFHNYQEFHTDDVLQQIANGILAAGSPKVRVSGNIIDSPGQRYGKDFFYGDTVLVQVGGYSFDVILNKITNTLGGNNENPILQFAGSIDIQ